MFLWFESVIKFPFVRYVCRVAVTGLDLILSTLSKREGPGDSIVGSIIDA